MPYQFNFNLTRISRSFFREIASIAHSKGMHKRIGEAARNLLEKFRIHEITGLDVSEALILLEDFIDIQMKNMIDRERFLKSRRRALLLPHCARKFMDGRCKASFEENIPSYRCSHCSPDCLVNQAATLGERRGYDIYILPGGSCIHQILKKERYGGIVGVACGQEIKLAEGLLEKVNIAGQAIPLIKNGCVNTRFDIQALKRIL